MPTPATLEKYLAKLEKALGSMPASEKAEIVINIKNQVLETQKKTSQDIESILTSLGTPTYLANKYLFERKLPARPQFGLNAVKWIVGGVVGIFVLCVASIWFLVWKFTPLVEVDGEKGRVRILGGLIDINEDDGMVEFETTYKHGDGKVHKFEGRRTVDLSNPPKVDLFFSNGKLDLSTSRGDVLIWSCKTEGSQEDVNITANETYISIDMNRLPGVSCDVKVPAKLGFRAEGGNGKVVIDEPLFHVDLTLQNGKVGLAPSKEANYNYSLSVVNGRVDRFESADIDSAIKIAISLGNGQIKKGL